MIYKDIEEYRAACAEIAARNQINMAADWREITAAIAAGGYLCTCQTGRVRCPCARGVCRAKNGGECDCGLFVGHN